jgi:predicted patatin/cPLA2 family phospholipase
MFLREALPLVEAFREKKALLDRGDKAHETISTAAVLAGANLATIFNAGALSSFSLLGMSQIIDDIVAVSAAAANAAYFLTGRTDPGPSIYYRRLMNRHFINPWRPWKFIDLDYLERIYEETLDVDAVMKSRCRLHVVVTTAEGEKFLLNTKDPGVRLISAIKATSAMPILYNRPVEVAGRLCFDGVGSDCLPVREAMERFTPKNLLIVTNHPWGHYRERSMLAERILSKIYLARYSKALRAGFLSRDAVHNTAVDYVRSCRGCNIAVVSPDYEISTTTRDPEVLKQFALHGAEKVWEVFGSGPLPRSEVLL